jgi:hypothetical protein
MKKKSEEKKGRKEKERSIPPVSSNGVDVRCAESAMCDFDLDVVVSHRTKREGPFLDDCAVFIGSHCTRNFFGGHDFAFLCVCVWEL